MLARAFFLLGIYISKADYSKTEMRWRQDMIASHKDCPCIPNDPVTGGDGKKAYTMVVLATRDDEVYVF